MTQSLPSPVTDKETRTGVSWPRLLGVLVLALLVRAYLCAQPACISRDGVQFVNFAKQLDDDPIRWMRIHTKQPGFSYLLLATHSSFSSVFGGNTPEAWQRCGELLAMLGGIAVCGLIYLLAHRLYDNDQIATAAAVLAAFWPHGAHLSADVLSDIPHLALYLAALLLAYGAMSVPRIWKLFVCGILCGIAYLLRQEALGLLAAVAFGVLWMRPFKTWTRNLSSILVLLIGFAVTVAPYSIACGKIMPNKGLQNLVDQLGLAPKQLSLLLAHTIPLWQAPGRMAEEWAKSGRYVFSTLFVLSLIIKTVPRAEQKGKQLVLVAVGIHVALVLLRVRVFGEISSRYMIIPAVLCLPWAAASMMMLFATITDLFAKANKNAKLSRTETRLVLLCGWAVILAPLAYYICLPVNDGKQPYRIAGLWLRKQAASDDVVLAHERLEQLMFYANRTYPNQDKWQRSKESDSIDVIRRKLRRKRPAWLVDATASRRRPIHESRFFESLSALTDLTGVYTTDPAERRVHIFRTSMNPEPKRPQ